MPNRWKCSECLWIGMDDEILIAPNPFDPLNSTVIGCPNCKTVDSFENLCDEPRCNKSATSGWPTPEGKYRRTCYLHSNYKEHNS